MNKSRKRRNCDKPPVAEFKRLSLEKPNLFHLKTAATLAAPPPTWGQLKKLAAQAEHLVLSQGCTLSPSVLFVAMLSILACQVSTCSAEQFWAFFPNPPHFHPVTWDDNTTHFIVNNTAIMGGPKIVYSDSHTTPTINYNYTYLGTSPSMPICFSIPTVWPYSQNFPQCVGLQTTGIIFDHPPPSKFESSSTRGKQSQSEERHLQMVRLIAPGIEATPVRKWPFDNYSPFYLPHPLGLPDCSQKFFRLMPSAPYWVSCYFNSTRPQILQAMDGITRIFDWTSPDPFADYKPYFRNKTNYKGWDQTLLPDPINVNRISTSGWVAPVLTAVVKGQTYLHKYLWQATAASHPITASYFSNNQTTFANYSVTTCVQTPYALLVSPTAYSLSFIMDPKTKLITTSCKECILTNCMRPELKAKAFVLLRQPPYIMVPVNVTDSWHENSGLEALQKLDSLMRPKRFIAALILGITALITIVTSLTVSTIALAQEVHTAHFTNELSKNVTTALTTQEIIDRKLDDKVNVLEEAVMAIGQEILTLKIQLSLRCHSDYKWICVTPLRVNESEHNWERVQSHILGVWNHSDLGIDLSKLHKQISDINHASEEFSPEGIAQSLYDNFSSWVSGSSLTTLLINVGVALLVLLICLLLIPVFFKVLARSLQKLTAEVQLLALKNKKGGNEGTSRMKSHSALP
ncbi:endogenous retrovirus group K member 6 Env polyprotein-like isoform X1 [Felis catus]|uniref:Retroviral envelope protein GP41-like domain-containing protein n=4 Tax=Felis catus TaxID=9685 RepID=A0ABI7XSW1_FELCA|nr:endogenous retrovirus group K member 6 Env polyprotein-like isoform X1 [Felis catus]XP_044917570.1 endogenous retrovirus group K member 6 Env polyprotein-like isoform X1 [Felis catus]XP_044917571.1 endogenous retrovirus group K member 6 Env polyprotein-like isoform X1 [Felis catus]